MYWQQTSWSTPCSAWASRTLIVRASRECSRISPISRLILPSPRASINLTSNAHATGARWPTAILAFIVVSPRMGTDNWPFASADAFKFPDADADPLYQSQDLKDLNYAGRFTVGKSGSGWLALRGRGPPGSTPFLF